MGPTACGKTALSLEICRKYKNLFEVVSSDSVQVYKYLDIGSGKVSRDIRDEIPHHMIDVVLPDEPFDVSLYRSKAERICADILNRKRIPLFVGGSGMYVDSFFFGLSVIPDISPEKREMMIDEVNERGLSALYDEYCLIDPVSSKKVHANDAQRIIRALLVYRETGKPISYYWDTKVGVDNDNILYIGIDIERKELFTGINGRVDDMIAGGLVDEVISLNRCGYCKPLPSMTSIGYSQVSDYIDGRITLDKAVVDIKHMTRKFAKRQTTWFKRNKKIVWFKKTEFDDLFLTINKWII